MRAEDYLRLLHPDGAHGQATLMRLDDNVKCARTFDCASLPFAASVWLDVSAYVTLHRFHGPRTYGRLAALIVPLQAARDTYRSCVLSLRIRRLADPLLKLHPARQ